MSTASVATRRTVPTASWPPAPTIGTPAWPRGARNPEGQPACPGGATLEVWSEPHPNRAGVCVYAPSTIVTVTIEVGHDDSDEVHFHAGGQGFWIARLLGRLGVPTTMCSAFGGEAGRVARSLVEAEPIEVRAVETSDENGSWVHDRRRGERQTLADVPGSALRRHVADELYGATLTAAMAAGVCVLAGPHRRAAVPAEHYRRLAADLRRAGTIVVADLSGADLAAALDGGVDLCKVSQEDLADTVEIDIPDDELEALRALRALGADNVVMTRGGRPLLASVGDEVLEARTPELEVADHRGAGDAFTALVAATQHWGLDWREAIRWGASAGSLTVVRRGLATADRREIHRFLDRIELVPLG